jgi:hypothetical protein
VSRCDWGGVWYGWWCQSQPPSRSRAWGGGGARIVELNKPTMECESHSSNNCINGSNCCGVA